MKNEIPPPGAAPALVAIANDSLQNSPEESANDGNAFEQYKMLFDDYQKTRSERASYNQHFLTLLFVQTLVAVLTALLKDNITQIAGYSQMLLAFVFATAAAISIAWALKLWMLAHIISAQNQTLWQMEDDLSISIPYKMLRTSWQNLSAHKYRYYV
jgi:hypothetical protein